MDQQHFRLGGQGVLMLAIAAAFPTGAHGAPAARVDFAIGNATAQGQNGQVRPLTKGAEVGQGDTVNTADGRVQLRFVDGAFVSLQPQSQFRIDEFRFNGQQDGSEKGFFSLLKGGLRTITGLVGRNNKSAYQVTTTVATIGIRGTEYTIVYGKSISGSVGEGEINVCNAGGCLNVTNGESYYVQSPDIRPVRTDKKVDLPAPQPQPVPSGFAAGDNRDPSGDPVSFILAGAQTVNFAYSKPGLNHTVTSTPAPVVFNSSGGLQSYSIAGVVDTWAGPIPSSATQPPQFGNDGVIAWGRWTGGITVPGDIDLQNGKSLHYVAGLPVGSSMPSATSGTLVGTYQVIGGTAPTTSDGSVTGALTAATFSANFGTSTVSASVTVAYPATINGAATGASFTGAATGNIVGENFYSSFSGGCSFSCAGLTFDGFFAGANARRAGMAYELNTGAIGLQGTAAFSRTDLP